MDKKEEKKMYIQQTDLFRGVDKDFLKKVMDITVKESREQGDYLFRAEIYESYDLITSN